MRKLLFLSLICVLTFSCSSDDDGGTPEIEIGLQDLLVDQSPWEFNNVEVLEITQQSNPESTNQEIENMVRNRYQDITFTFNQNETGSFVTPDNQTIDFSYELNTATDEIVFEGFTFGFSSTLSNVSIAENNFQFEVENSAWDGENPESEVSYEGKFTFY